MNDKVTMRSPEGEVREVEATPDVLTPLMAAGWHQQLKTDSKPVKAAKPAKQEGE